MSVQETLNTGIELIKANPVVAGAVAVAVVATGVGIYCAVKSHKLEKAAAGAPKLPRGPDLKEFMTEVPKAAAAV